ncbi:uncharacterized protein BXZ73DRAFT_108628 [Epithele typhae]|uniref:uncharacterized protein n=1 Tax=Epithele typhae TaxID=378194 RepID=UPI002007BD9A|nr:uncharacterized protein BXZ73DRAFT_108628 [Epithele typhae]KAH9910696.1 hypothetical protein BXZ73DRAFT_108628 [Epithele typhae]
MSNWLYKSNIYYYKHESGKDYNSDKRANTVPSHRLDLHPFVITHWLSKRQVRTSYATAVDHRAAELDPHLGALALTTAGLDAPTLPGTVFCAMYDPKCPTAARSFTLAWFLRCGPVESRTQSKIRALRTEDRVLQRSPKPDRCGDGMNFGEFRTRAFKS